MMTLRALQCRRHLDRLAQLARRLDRPLAFMEVCGTHTVNAFRSGLHSLMPENVKLLSGPGCPVCVTSQGDIDALIELAFSARAIICTYGDMLRVNGSRGSLEQARSVGAQVRVVYSAMDAVKLAAKCPGQQVVFAAVGFETTAPATAAAILAAHSQGLNNFTALASHKLIIPAMHALLSAARVNIDGFLCPGHVSIVIGSDAYLPIVRQYGMPCVIAGFEDVQIAQGLARLLEIVASGEAALDNLYPEAVTVAGNTVAQRLLEQVFTPVDVAWRALGRLPGSGLAIRSDFAEYDAAARFDIRPVEAPEPPGCRCGDVITGRCTPEECGLFGRVCTPTSAVGPCMVSSEGTCAAWFKYAGVQHLHGHVIRPRKDGAGQTRMTAPPLDASSVHHNQRAFLEHQELLP